MLPHLITHSLLQYLLTGCLWEVKDKGKFQPFSYKSGRGAYTVVASTCKLLVFWKTGRLWDVVATKGSTVCELQKRETWDKDAISPEVCGVLCKAQEILFKHVLWKHGGHMVSAWPADWWVWVLSLAGDIVLRHLTLAVPFSTQVYKWVYKINGYKFSAGKG